MPVLRPLENRDSLSELTALLHRAYAALGAMGLNYTAVDQDEATTRRRMAGGQCFVLSLEDKLVGTLTVRHPDPASDCAPFRQAGRAHIVQFAIDPAMQGRSLGDRLMRAAEDWAREQCYDELLLDTAEPAHHLVALYQRRAFQLIGHTQWPGKRYRSVVMSKPLA